MRFGKLRFAFGGVLAALVLVGTATPSGALVLPNDANGHTHVAGVVTDPERCARVIRGAEQSGVSTNPAGYDYALTGAPGTAGDAIDHRFVQDEDLGAPWPNGNGSPVVFDLGAGNSAATWDYFPTIDHVATGTNDPAPEALEATVYGSDDGANIAETGDVTTIFDKGRDPNWISDDFVSRWSFASPHRYVLVHWGGPKAANADGDAEIDAVCTPEPPQQASGPDLSITKTAAPNPVLTGGTLTYTIGVTNNGPGNATNVTVTDTVPTSTTYQSATPSQGSCSQAAGTVTCNLGTLTSGASASVTIQVVPHAKGTITNTATVKSDQVDPNTANNTATVSTTVLTAEGSAFGEQVRSLLVNSGPLPTVFRNTPGTSNNSLLQVNVPTVLSTGVLNESTTISPGLAVTSTSAVNNTKVGNPLFPVVTADVVQSTCSATQSGVSGSTTLVTAKVGGVPLLLANPGPNTVISVPGVATVILNEQILGADGSITVNAVHVTLLGVFPGLTTDVIIAQSRCLVDP